MNTGTVTIGDLLLAGDECGLSLVGFPEGPMCRQPESDWIYSEKPFVKVREQLTEYFDGTRKNFDLSLNPDGTAFQLQVLCELQKISYGSTASYGEIARRIGRPKAVRAFGAANGRNPLPIIIPCHRVVGSNGKLTGFAGGLAAKEALLRLEAEQCQIPRAGEVPAPSA